VPISPVFLRNYVNGRQQLTKVKVYIDSYHQHFLETTSMEDDNLQKSKSI